MGQEHSSFYSDSARTRLLNGPVVSVLLLNRPLFTVSPDASLLDVLRIFRTKNISCVPIIYGTDKSSSNHGNHGNADSTAVPPPPPPSLLSIVDLTTFITTSYAQLGAASFTANLKSILRVSCAQLADFSTHNSTHSISTRTSLLDAARTMDELRVSRLLLRREGGTRGGRGQDNDDDADAYAHDDDRRDDRDALVGMVTQSNLVEAILLNLDTLHPNPDATLHDLHLHPTSPVVACLDSTPTIAVLQDMRGRNVTAVPVVSATSGTMVGIMTVRHLKTLISTKDSSKIDSMMNGLFLPAGAFLKQVGATFVTAARETTTLRALLRLVVVNTYHHVFFCDEAGRVEGVVALGDLIRWCVLSTADHGGSGSAAAAVTSSSL
ncbi:AMP-activated serine/threonine-protein kinase regulatory subunit [Geranomyces michiganensis]|nr:AMP-activated serine/threonine-protein kinase regulatory subunit [Geranomyces michiganensis]